MTLREKVEDGINEARQRLPRNPTYGEVIEAYTDATTATIAAHLRAMADIAFAAEGPRGSGAVWLRLAADEIEGKAND